MIKAKGETGGDVIIDLVNQNTVGVIHVLSGPTKL